MRILLLSAVLALGGSLAGPVGASVSNTVEITNKAATMVSPRVKLAAKGCRDEERCDPNGEHCEVVHRCR